jgi:pyrrolidone-carboxylate peptidase
MLRPHGTAASLSQPKVEHMKQRATKRAACDNIEQSSTCFICNDVFIIIGMTARRLKQKIVPINVG